MKVTSSIRRQKGAVIITVALFLMFLLGFMGIAMDLGRLFVVKTELQTAMDACALAAVQELDRQPNSITRARAAGIAAGTRNRVDMQGRTPSLVDTTLTFYTDTGGGLAETTVPEQAIYVRCTHLQNDVRSWVLHTMGAFTGDLAANPNTRSVGATAVATWENAQRACVLPLVMRQRNGTPPDYGYTPGEWVPLLISQSATTGGDIGWANTDGSNGASTTEDQLRGNCPHRSVDDPITMGVQSGVADAWNARFGIYRNSNVDITAFGNRPDYTGYSYTSTNWPSRFNAYRGERPAGAPEGAANFITKRQAFASCADTGTRVRGGGPGTPTCESITGLQLESFNDLATPGASGEHARYGMNRRLATVPIVNAGGRIEAFACMLMLQPLPVGNGGRQIEGTIYLEYIGNANEDETNGRPRSPCTTTGRAGGSGPRVPVLVR